ncbi:hypothetical protein SAMN05216278_1929 [Halopelagius longus]|uniref:Uncharacterized protein n=1 Tax=Halopelagius longus TaxID=1236180 RepID=A0A1H1BSK5_9EURY|nr:hypothetical protein SAMN05216278_1929 [Halopelagius longus]
MTDPKPFRFDTEVPPGEKRHLRYEVSETYLGDPVEIPVAILNGERCPLCHPVSADETTCAEIEREIDAGEFSERPWA